MKVIVSRLLGTAVRVVTPATMCALGCAFALSSCMTFQPSHRREIRFAINGSHDQFQMATRNASERMGGSIIELSIFTPRSADIVDTSRREQSSIYIGFMTPTSGPILDSLALTSYGPDSGIVSIKAFYPLIAGKAIQEEMDYPRTMTSVSERKAARTAMDTKSKLVFSGLTLLSPALANTYLLIGNPFAGDNPEFTSILIPLAADAGFAFFALSEQGYVDKEKTQPKSKAGMVVLGIAALFMRLNGLFGLSSEIDRFNTVVRSGYNVDLDDIRFFKTQLTWNVPIP